MESINDIGFDEAIKGNTFVVRTRKNTKPILWRVVGISDVFSDSLILDADGELLNHIKRKELRLANDAETQDKKRNNL